METLDKRNPFTVPEGYFDTLPDVVMKRIEEQERPSRRHLFRRILIPTLSMAALFLFAILFVQVILPLVVDDSMMLQTHTVTQLAEQTTPAIDDSFNPTDSEIVEYLSEDTNPEILLFAYGY